MNRGDSKEHANQNKEKSTRSQLNTSNYRQLRKAGNGRCGFSQGGAHQLFLSYQKVSLENIHASSISLTLQCIFNNIYMYTYMRAITVYKRI